MRIVPRCSANEARPGGSEMARSADKILTTHVGSLVRPEALVAYLRQRESGKPYDHKAFDACLAESIHAVLKRQAEIGIDIVSDGEFGRSGSWSRYVMNRLDGFEQRPLDSGKDDLPPSPLGKEGEDFADFYAEYLPKQNLSRPNFVWTVTGPVKYRGQSEIRADIESLSKGLAGVDTTEAFMPAVAPASVSPSSRDEYYRNEKDYLFALAEALREEYRAIVDAGFMVQIDDAYLATTYGQIVPPGTLDDYRRWATLRVDALNHALEGIPEDRTRYHVCWGSWNGPHASDVEVKDIVDLILKVRVGCYSLEMANPRHEHEWRIWETTKLPEGRKLLPGVISHATNVVEHPDLVAERIVRLAKLVGRENVIASTDCGFAQGPFVRRVHPSIMWAKLESLAEGARRATRELWGRG